MDGARKKTGIEIWFCGALYDRLYADKIEPVLKTHKHFIYTLHSTVYTPESNYHFAQSAARTNEEFSIPFLYPTLSQVTSTELQLQGTNSQVKNVHQRPKSHNAQQQHRKHLYSPDTAHRKGSRRPHRSYHSRDRPRAYRDDRVSGEA